MKKTCMAVLLLIGSVGMLLAAAPPDRINYQGVLRDASDSPLDGSHDMVFRFWTADVAGDEILVDEHTAAHGNPVTVSVGMFNVELGGGVVSDGSGPGAYNSLADVFGAHSLVYMQIQVGSELLSPRVRIVASAYALNAGKLDGKLASQFVDTTSVGQTKTGPFTADATGQTAFGISGSGSLGGGYFEDTDSSGFAHVGYGDYGIQGFGNDAGGYFSDRDSTGYAYVGYEWYGIWALGQQAGGVFYDGDGSGYAHVGIGDWGVLGYGDAGGGVFQDDDGTGYSRVGYGDRGIEGYGNEMGGYFADRDDTGFAYVGYAGYGVQGRGATAGGYFADTDSSSYAYIAHGDYGVDARGGTAGGRFRDSNSSGDAYVGYGDRGIEAYGNDMGGYFEDADGSGYARLGFNNWGVRGFGSGGGGYFQDLDSSAYADVGRGDRGIEAFGDVMGGKFQDLTSSNYGYVGYDTYKIYGTGTVNFVQNHPEDPSRVIAYTAPEGDEVATYTRGSARLVGGEARIALGETFRWVTNPDIGLTAHVSPREECNGLRVVSVDTRELVVRELGGGWSDAAFDYIVYGLRIGFEEVSVVQEKTTESFIPSMASHRQRYADQPELRAYNALERFKRMRADIRGTDVEDLDLSASLELRNAIHEYDPATDPPARELLGHGQLPEDGGMVGPPVPAEEELVPASDSDRPDPVSRDTAGELATVGGDAVESTTSFPVLEAVEPGDLLTLDLERPGSLRLAGTAADGGVVGIVAGDPFEENGVLRAPVALYGLATVKVDAGYGEIRAGDLLTSSFTPGHAMRATEIVPGTVIGKALEPLEAGTGLIQVLVMPR
jgi:hypothetical protein